jgi:PEP-CTERM motif
MNIVYKLAFAAAATLTASPSLAAVAIVGPTATAASCSAFTFSGATESACAGGYEGNLLQGSLQDPGLTAIQALGYTGTGAFLDKIDLDGSTLDFGTTLTGLTIIGIHYGAAGAGPEATSFFLLDAGAGTNTLTVTGRTGANSLGLSNAVLFSTGTRAVPEPATWAMMLLGFGAIGVAVGRRRRTHVAAV